jgi:hypothetical protein
VIGLMSAAHLATLLVRSRVVSALDMTKIGTACVGLTILTFAIHIPADFFQFWLQSQAPFAIGISGAFLLAKYRNRALEESLDDLISRIILRMRDGHSLSIGFELVAGEMRSSIRVRWLEIARYVSFSPQEINDQRIYCSDRVMKIVREFRRIDSLTRSQISELIRWRSRMRVERRFRRKSGQATAQVRAQSIILSVIFVLLTFFSVGVFGWRATRAPLQVAVPLFLLGLYLIWRSGREIKWSV